MRWYEKGYDNDNVKKTMLFIGITLAVYLTMKYILPVVIPFLLGGLLAMLLNPLVERIVKRTRRGRGMISMLVMAVVLAASGVICFFAVRAVCMQLGTLAQNAEEIERRICGVWCDCCDRVERSLGVSISQPEQLFVKMQNKVRSGFQASTLPYLLKNSVSYAKTVFSVLSVLLVSVISGLLILSDYPKIASALRGSAAGKFMIEIKEHMKKAGGTYFKAQIMILAVISAICVAGLLLTGNPYALLAGMGIGLCDALPFVGTGTIFVPWMIIDIMNGRYVMAAVYGILYVICSFVRQLLEPRLIGDRLGFPPILVLMSIYIGIHVYGAAGVLLGPASALLIWEIYTLL